MESGYQTFLENFTDCCKTSCTRLAYEHLQTDRDFAAKATECNNLYQQIEKKLGPDSQLIDDFDVAKNCLHATDVTFVYQQGFQDCIHLLRWMDIL